MSKSEELDKKDSMMKDAFLLLQSKDIDSNWIKHERPYTALQEECQGLIEDLQFVSELKTYLNKRDYIRRSAEMMLIYMSMSENSRWQETPEWMHVASAKGWHLIRWIPTFLMINGPIGRFLLRKESPLYSRLGNNIPIITAAHNFLEIKDFKTLRNGFAHWSFDWEVFQDKFSLIVYEEGKDIVITRLLIGEIEGFHAIAFAITEVLNDIFFKS